MNVIDRYEPHSMLRSLLLKDRNVQRVKDSYLKSFSIIKCNSCGEHFIEGAAHILGNIRNKQLQRCKDEHKISWEQVRIIKQETEDTIKKMGQTLALNRGRGCVKPSAVM